MGCCYSVSESNVAIIERFGRFSHVLHPGFNCVNCCTQKVAGELSFKIQQYNLDFNTRTKDNVFVTLKFAFMLKVAENAAELAADHAELPVKAPAQPARIGQNVNDEIIYRAFYNLKAPVPFITAEIEAYFRSHSMNYTMDEMFAARENLTKDICTELNRKLSPHGYVVRSVMVTDINPDHNVVKSMNDVVAAQKDRQAQIARAEAEKNAAILRAEGEARTRELEGAGIAAQRRRIVEGLQESVNNFKQALPNADPNQLLSTVLMTQYLDVLKEAASHGRNTFILPSSPAHIQALEGQIGMALLGTASVQGQSGKREDKMA